MPNQRLLALAMDARDRAEEIFTGAKTFQDEYAKQKMREIAADYQNLADQLERRAGDEP
jgi:hypothetical protein